jgi:hypothetical protein
MTTTVPRRHRRDNREAKRNREQNLDAELRSLTLEHERQQPPAPPPKPRVPLRDRERLPLARPVMKDPKGELKWAAGHVGNRVAHHGLRLDQHTATFARAAGRGARRAVTDIRAYVRMPATLDALAKLVEAGRDEKHADLARRYEERRKARRARAQAVGGPVAGAVAVGWLALAGWLTSGDPAPDPGTFLCDLPVAALPFLAVAVVACAVHGRQRGSDKPGTVRLAKADHRPVQLAPARPTADMVYAAFDASGIKGIVCELAPHRVGAGWEAVVRIPVGNDTFKTAAKAHDRIAGNLGIGAECLVLAPIPTAARGSEKHVRIWWTRTDPFRGDPIPHPLLDPRRIPADLWNDGLPIGTDPRGSEIRIAMVDTPFVGIVGRPGSGKSFAFLDVITGIAADPLWDLDCWSFKPSDDFSPAKPLVKAGGGVYRCGTDDATFEAFYRYLCQRRAEYTERNKALGRLPIERRFRMKVERDVAADPDLVPSMRPRAVLVDEILTALGSKKWGTKILGELEELARTIRSQNGVFFFGSQFADSGVFEDLQKLLGARICLSVARWQDSKGALGGDHDPDTADASKIPLAAKGVAIVAGAMDDPVIGERPTVKGRFYGNDLRWVNDHIDRCLAGPRAGQAPAVQLAKADPVVDAFVGRLRAALNGDEALTCTALGERLELGAGAVAAKRLAEQARAAGIEPRKDTTGGVTGRREALYVHREQLN